MKFAIVIVTLAICAVGSTQAQGFRRPEAYAGRWHVQTTSGDQPAQVAAGTPVTFDAWVVCNTGACGAIQIFMRDSTICDAIGFENTSGGMVINGSSGAFQFAVAGSSGDFFIYTYVGMFAETFTTTGTKTALASATISGTYGSTPGGCNNGIPTDQGTFMANWFPPITGKYFLSLSPAQNTERSFEVELTLNQAVGGIVLGTATTGQLVLTFGGEVFEPTSNPCFSSENLTVVQGPGSNVSYASGDQFQVYALDTAGVSLTLQGVAKKAGSNNDYTVKYSIVGGVCNGVNGTSSRFQVATTAPARSSFGLTAEDQESSVPQP